MTPDRQPTIHQCMNLDQLTTKTKTGMVLFDISSVCLGSVLGMSWMTQAETDRYSASIVSVFPVIFSLLTMAYHVIQCSYIWVGVACSRPHSPRATLFT